MNIFVLSEDPVVAARMQCNSHCTKMIVESAQMLSYAHLIANKDKRWVKRNITYKLNKGHASHPCTLWVIEDSSHYAWLFRFMLAMIAEYDYRFDGLKRGKYASILKLIPKLARLPLDKQRTAYDIRANPTNFALAMNKAPECYGPYAVDSYRRFYIVDKHDFATWKVRNPPAWYVLGLRQYLAGVPIQNIRVV